jgi:predicted O-methyltransferase YrrM
MIKLRPAIEIVRQSCRPPICGAEIGVLGGTHARSMLRHLPNLSRLYLIDPYGGITDRDPKFLQFKAKFGADNDRITWHVRTSMEAVKRFSDQSLDFVYIDANHRFYHVAQDIRAWWPKVRMGGLLAGHDYFTYGSVKKAVDEWAKGEGYFLFTTDPDWWVFRE